MTEQKLAGLNQASQQKKNLALLKTEKAIARLIKDCQKITIRSVAKEAGVSVSYIYKYPELAYKIQRLKEREKYDLPKDDRPIAKTNNKEKQPESVTVPQKNETKNGRNNNLQKLQQENEELIAENKRLQAELKYIQQQLQEARKFILARKDRLDEIEVAINTKAIRRIDGEKI